jgi:hypothetical protein
MELKQFRQRLKDDQHVGIHVMSKHDALYVEKLLYKYNYYWVIGRRFVNELNYNEIILDINYRGSNKISWSPEPNDGIHDTNNLIFFPSSDIKKVEYLFNDNFSIKPSYKPKQIIRTI